MQRRDNRDRSPQGRDRSPQGRDRSPEGRQYADDRDARDRYESTPYSYASQAYSPDEYDHEREDHRFAGQYGQHDVNQGRFEAHWGAGNSGFESTGYGAASSEREGASAYGQTRHPERSEFRRGSELRLGRYGEPDNYREPAQRSSHVSSHPSSRHTSLPSYGIGGLQQGGFASPASRAEASYFGRGPKGYTRSDERIREDLSERLHDDHHVDASDITVVVKDGEVTLTGSVETRRQKHDAEDLADAVSGVRDVHNQLRVTKGVMSQIADKVQAGVERLTGEHRTEPVRTNNNRSAS